MTLVAGLSLGSTAAGKTLYDGGAALIESNRIRFAVAEERIARRKHAGGHALSLAAILKRAEIAPGEISAVVTSSCCEPERSVDLGFADDGTHSCNHHLSHAIGAFMTSPYETALAIVSDAGGNTLTGSAGSRWWSEFQEQVSVFYMTREHFVLLGREFVEPGAFGPGEAFRAFCYYLGWHDSAHAGKVMALAALADPAGLEADLFDRTSSSRRLATPYDPNEPMDAVHRIARHHSIRDGPREPKGTITDGHIRLARYLQDSLESYLASIIERYLPAGVTNVVLSGGTALNCRAIGSLSQRVGLNVHVHPGSGDTGQCLGNAGYGVWLREGALPRLDHFDPFLGSVDVDLEGLSEDDTRPVLADRHDYDAAGIVDLLVNGTLVGHARGRAEYGPRALGGRSIVWLHPETSPQVARIKGREWFLPFAPVTFEDRLSAYFETGRHDPFMVSTRQVRPAFDRRGWSHQDGSARVQSVRREEKTHPFWGILHELERRGLDPVIFNTSLNRRGQPIPETARDCLVEFQGLDLDSIVIGTAMLLRRA